MEKPEFLRKNKSWKIQKDEILLFYLSLVMQSLNAFSRKESKDFTDVHGR